MILTLNAFKNFVSSFGKEELRKPHFPPETKSLLSKYLTNEVWEKLKNQKDEVGFTFQECIK